MPGRGSGEGREATGADLTVERFLGEPTRELHEWRWLWDRDVHFPIRSHRRLVGRLIVVLKRLLRPFVKLSQQDLWERQRIFNLIVLEYLQRGDDLKRLVEETHAARLDHLEAMVREGLAEVVEHNDALFARVDQKMDRGRRELREVWGRLASALAVAEDLGGPALSEVRAEHVYQGFERRFRGTPEEIVARAEHYVPRLLGRGVVLDLGCGRGEALSVLRDAGVEVRGVDGSEAMVDECRQQGLDAERGDLFAVLAAQPAGSLGGVVSFHVVEHLAATSLDRLVRLAWRALVPGGLLILETPNPTSLVVASRNFWLDPTHLRPIHPDAMIWLFRECGFDPVERIDLRPFGAAERLREIDLDELPAGSRPLAQAVNDLRDHLDDLLYGTQDYAVIGVRPEA